MLLDAQRWTGQADAARLVEAAASVPGGAALLVFALFWSPIAAGVPLGVVLARSAGLHPLATFGIYALSDVLGALICHPLFVLLLRAGGRVRTLRWLGQRTARLAMIGTDLPSRRDRAGSPSVGLALMRIGAIAFGIDVYAAGMLVAALPVPRLAGWAAVIVGDLLWFALVLGASVATAAVVDDNRVVGAAVVVAMVAAPQLAQRLVPALRPARRSA
jgi:hypothetical protein